MPVRRSPATGFSEVSMYPLDCFPREDRQRQRYTELHAAACQIWRTLLKNGKRSARRWARRWSLTPVRIDLPIKMRYREG